MANHSSAKKSIRQNETRYQRNKSRMSRIRTQIKKVLAAIEAGNKDEAQSLFRIAQSELMRGVKTGILKLNTASRRVKKLAAKVKSISA